MAYTRVFNHYNSSHVLQGAVSAHAVGNATFKLSRYGGCMEGSLTLDTSFVDRTDFAYNDWISFEHTPGTRWYYGQIKHRQSTSPQTLTLHLLGAVDQLHRIFPGSYTIPLVYGSSSGWFPDDPDKAHESYVGWTELSDIVKHLLDYDIVPSTDIVYDAGDIEATGVTIKQLKFRGTEHALSIIKGLGLQGIDASWGVDADRGFFYIQKPGATQATYQEGVDVTLLRGDYGDAYLFNRLWLIGGWVYRTLDVGVIMPHYQFQQHYRRSTSVTAYGERRLKITAPWIRNEDDGYTFATSFLDVYATPSERAIVTVTDPPSLITPWGGQVRVLDRNGVQVALAHPIDIEYDFDEVPVARFEVGPIDPTVLYPDQDWDDRRPSSGGGEDAGTTVPPTTAPPTTAPLTTEPPTTAPVPTTAPPTTVAPTTAPPTTAVPTTVAPTTAPPTTAVPTTVVPTTAPPTTAVPTSAPPACPDCASPPATVTVAISGSPAPDCNDTFVCVWDGNASSCSWSVTKGSVTCNATWVIGEWNLTVTGDCLTQCASTNGVNCNTGGSCTPDGGGTAIFTP